MVSPSEHLAGGQQAGGMSPMRWCAGAHPQHPEPYPRVSGQWSQQETNVGLCLRSTLQSSIYA